MKKLFSILTALMVVFNTMVPVSVSANSRNTIQPKSELGPGEWWGYINGEKPAGEGNPAIIHMVKSDANKPDMSGHGVDDHIGYCYNASKPFPTDPDHTGTYVKYKETTKMMPVVRGILLAGYPNDITNFEARMGDRFEQGYQTWKTYAQPSYGEKTKDMYFHVLTQCAIWYVRGPEDGGETPENIKNVNFNHGTDTVSWDLMMELVNYGKQHALDAPINGIPPINHLNGQPVNKENPLTLNDNGESEPFTVGKDYKITVEIPESDQYKIVDAKTQQQVYYLEPGGECQVKLNNPQSVTDGQEIRVKMVRMSKTKLTNYELI